MTLKGVFPIASRMAFLRMSRMRDRCRGFSSRPADEYPCRAKASDARGVMPRQVLAKAMKDRLKATIGMICRKSTFKIKPTAPSEPCLPRAS